jgi:hypothetical protein
MISWRWYKCLMLLTHVALCVWCLCKRNNGHGNCGFLWGRMNIEPDDCREYITASLCLFDCISLSFHNIVDYGVTKSKQHCIKLMPQHDGLSYYRACVFVLLSGNVASWCFVGCALCIT